MNRVFNKAFASYSFLVYFLNPLEFQITQQRTFWKTNKICYVIVSIDHEMTLELH